MKDNIEKDNLEIEAKFLCPEEIAEQEFTALLESLGLQVEWLEPRLQRDIYLDEADGRLLREGSALRVRSYAGKHVATFKGPGSEKEGIFQRPEIEWELFPEAVEAFEREGCLSFPLGLPAALAASRLVRVLTVETRRRRAPLRDEDDLLLELTLDECTFSGPGGEARHREIELELKRGEPARLSRVASALQARFSLLPSTKSKFALAMEKVGPR